MSNENYTTLVIPTALQNLSVQYMPEGFINEYIAPTVQVNNLSHKILKYTKASYFRLQAESMYRAPGTRRTRVDLDHEVTTANPKQISREVPVADEFTEFANMPGQIPVDPAIDAITLLKNQVELLKEIEVSRIVYGTTWLDGYAGGITMAGGWGLTTLANTMISSVMTAKKAFVDAHGYEPDCLAMDYQTFNAQHSNPNFQAKMNFTGMNILTEDIMAQVLGL